MSEPATLDMVVRAATDPLRRAVVDLSGGSPREWTAEAFHGAVDAFAAGLIEAGHEPGARIGLLASNSATMLQAYFGIMRAGMVAVPINHRLAADTIAFIVEDANLSHLFYDPARAALRPAGVSASLLHLPEGGAVVDLASANYPIAKILYTSGSTGRPKGVVLDHAGQAWAIRHTLAALPPPVADAAAVVAAPFYHKNGLYHATMALATGTLLVLLPGFDARTYLSAVARYRARRVTGVPTMFALMAREMDLRGSLDLSSVAEVSVGSAPLSEALASQIAEMFPSASLSNGYGTTEAGPVVFAAPPAGVVAPPTSLGVPDSAIEWRLAGDSSEGVLQLRTPAMMHGYLNAPELTATRLVDGWYDTGDIMRIDEQGLFHFVGRADDMFVCGGENIFPAEVEMLMERHPDIAQAAVVPAPDAIKGQIPVAFVVPRNGSHLDPEALKQFALDHGPAYSHPRAVVVRDMLPLAGTHKIDRRALMAEAKLITANRHPLERERT